MTIMQYEPDILRDVLNMLTSHGLEILAVDPEKGEFVVRIPKL